jgi:PAS domain S-box-containing protein
VQGPETLFENIVDSCIQPIWIVNQAGRFQFLNRAAVSTLGYDAAADLLGAPSHETVQYRRADGTSFPVDESRLRRAQLARAPLSVDADWFVRRDGSMLAVSYVAEPVKVDGGAGATCAFQELRPEPESGLAVRRRIIEAGDAARRRLARDLHDGTQQQLVTAVLNLQLARQKFPRDPDAAEELLATGLERAEAGLRALRELVAGIHPAILTHLGLGPALDALATRLPLPVSLDLTTERFPPPVEASVYFFVSEALTNVIKHAQATDAGVVTARDLDTLVVEVRDDGIGGADVARGGGLAGLADRVAALDGVLGVTSDPGVGTTLRAVIPV